MNYSPNIPKACLSMLLASSLFFAPLSATVFAQDTNVQRPTETHDNKLNDSLARQVQALQDEKAARTPAQQKIDSQLLYAARMDRGEPVAKGVAKLEVAIKKTDKGLVLVDIVANVTDAALNAVREAGGDVISSYRNENAIRAALPLQSIEKLAEQTDIRFIRPADEAQTDRFDPREKGGDQPVPSETVMLGDSSAKTVPTAVSPFARARGAKTTFAERAANVRARLTQELTERAAKNVSDPTRMIGSRNSQGDVAHRADQARQTFGVNGAGIRIGVLSDSFNSLGAAQSDINSGDLPGFGNPNGFTTPVTVLQDTAGSDEGRAMLQIVHDLAPGAKLFYATAFNGVASFAENIRALRRAGCDIIIDDVFYFNESPFQDAPIARAVNDVTIGPGSLAGASYFSSAGNAGNLTDATSGVWEGDFNDSGSSAFGVAGGTFHDFDATSATAIQNPVLRTSGNNTAASLFWSDPLGASTNDYDLYLIENNGTTIVSASTNVQNGAQDPYEQVTVGGGNSGAPGGRRIAVFKKTAAAARFLHVNLNRNRFDPTAAANIPSFKTDGQTKGHSAAVAAFGTAASPAAGPQADQTPVPFSSSSVSETFSSDGPRRVFYNADGSPVTPGCFLAACSGGTIRQKPDITAADGVDTTLPPTSGLNPFFGTSAAAPHAGAIAALVKSANRNLTANQIRAALTSTAIDIEALGVDRTTGVGIVDAFSALQSINATPQAAVNAQVPSISITNGDGDQFIERGETAAISLSIRNTGAATARNVTARITSSSPEVAILPNDTVGFPNIDAGQTAAGFDTFKFRLQPSGRPGAIINFTITISFAGGVANPETFNFSLQTGQPGATATPVTFTGAAQIRDLFFTFIDFTLSGFTGNVSDVNFSIDGTNCSNTVGSTTVGIEHANVGDLQMDLTSPSGTLVTLVSRVGGNGVNFCQTIFDDSATTSIQSVTASQAPFTGTFRPAGSLAAFNGENPNGIWRFRVGDFVSNSLQGNIRQVTLSVTQFQGGAPTAAAVTIAGRVKTTDGRAISNAVVTATAADGTTRTARTNAFGRYQFDNVAAGSNVVFAVKHKQYRFSEQALNVAGENTDYDFTALP